jgi:hypothetical protein
MVNEQIQKIFEQRKVGLLEIQKGTQAFVQEILNKNDVEVVIAQAPLSPLFLTKNDSFPIDWKRAVQEFSLEDHTIKSTQVIPFAVILEWVMRMAQSYRPDLKFIHILEAHCYKGLIIPSNYSEPSPTIHTNILNNSIDETEIEVVCSHKNISFYKILLQMNQKPPSIDVLPLPLNASTKIVYDGVALFHGRKFQILDRLYAMDETGAVASLRFGKNTNRMLLIDGGIQLGVLWMHKTEGCASLPSRIKNIHIFDKAIPSELTVRLKGQINSMKSGSIQLEFFNSGGDLIAFIEDLLMTPYIHNLSKTPLYH